MSKKENTFFELALKSDALLLGDFTLKSGKKSPYFFNIGSLFSEGHILELANLYADLLIEKEISFDVIFGPAYKGIPLASALSASLTAKTSRPFPFAFDRKEEKEHGEGGVIVGDVKDKNILVIDDVLTAGTALKESIKLVSGAGGNVTSCLVALDREEIIDGSIARDMITEECNIEFLSIARISQLVEFLDKSKRGNEANIIRKHLSNN